MAYPFSWVGGTHKEGEHQTFKFFLFAMVEDQDPKEIIYFEAAKRHIFRKVEEDPSSAEKRATPFRTPYLSLVPTVKIFMGQQGFGIRKSYFSFFFQFTRNEGKIVTINPFGSELSNYSFQAKGRFLSTGEIKELVGEDSESYKYYCKQTYLSKTELSGYVSLSSLPTLDKPGPVRNIRV